MKSHRKYTTYEKERKVFAAVMLLLLVIILAWGVIEVVATNDKPVQWQTEHPMVNTQISFEQTHHPGPWGGAGDGD